jgi:hypothetical protein
MPADFDGVKDFPTTKGISGEGGAMGREGRHGCGRHVVVTSAGSGHSGQQTTLEHRSVATTSGYLRARPGESSAGCLAV